MINHGLINKIYFKVISQNKYQKIYDKHPEFIKYKAYFMRHYNRNRYYVALKYHAMTLIEKTEPTISQFQISDILNLHDRSTISYYKNEYKLIQDHHEFIKKYFNYCIENFNYPTASIYDKETKQHVKFKLVHIPENINQVKEIKSAKKLKVYVGKINDEVKNLKLEKNKRSKYLHKMKSDG